MYDNGDGTTSCVVLLDRYAQATYREAQLACERLNQPGSHLLEVQTLDKHEHLVNSGVLDAMTG